MNPRQDLLGFECQYSKHIKSPKPPAFVTAAAKSALAKPNMGALHRNGEVVLGNHSRRVSLDEAIVYGKEEVGSVERVYRMQWALGIVYVALDGNVCNKCYLESK